MIKIVIDSTADMPTDMRERFGIKVIPLRIQFGDEAFLDGVDITKEDFYERLLQSNSAPTTSTPSVGAFVDLYTQLAQETDTIVSIHLSGRMSSTVQTARQAAKMVSHAHVEVVDSHQMSMAISYMAVAASVAVEAGKELSEILDGVHRAGARTLTYVAFDTLKYLERGGRIGHARAFLGTLLKVKPIVEVRDGEVQPLEQVRTTKRMLGRMQELVQSHGALDELSVLWSTDPTLAEMMREHLVQAGVMPREQIQVVRAGGVIGTHVGPGALGVIGIRQHSP